MSALSQIKRSHLPIPSQFSRGAYGILVIIGLGVSLTQMGLPGSLISTVWIGGLGIEREKETEEEEEKEKREVGFVFVWLVSVPYNVMP